MTTWEVYTEISDASSPYDAPASSEKRPLRLTNITNNRSTKSNLVKSVAAVKQMSTPIPLASVAQKVSIDSAFDALDQNGDGVITRGEWDASADSRPPLRREAAASTLWDGIAGSTDTSPLPGYYSPAAAAAAGGLVDQSGETGAEDSPGIAEVLARNKDLLSRSQRRPQHDSLTHRHPVHSRVAHPTDCLVTTG